MPDTITVNVTVPEPTPVTVGLSEARDAYQIAVAEGFVGTRAEWLASLQGAQGEAGAAGADGAQGPAGADGAQGPPGADGADGADATPQKSGVCGSDEAGYENSDTLKNSENLSFALDAGTWDVEALIIVSCVNFSAGCKQKLDWSGAGTFLGGMYLVANGAVNAVTFPPTRQLGINVDSLRESANDSLTTLRVGRLVATSAGTLSVQFSSRQATAGVRALLAGMSYLRVVKVA